MILPQTYTGALILMILSLLCLGSWPNLYKLAGKWRYEFFYLDFAFGVLVTAGIAALTLGNLGFDGFSLTDDVIHAGRRQLVFAFMAGAIFNLGNVLLVAAMSVGGMAVAFPVGMGLTVILAMWIGKVNGAAISSGSLALGSALILAAVMANAFAYGSVMKKRRAALLAEGRKADARSAAAWKGLTLAGLGGLIMCGMYPLLGRVTLPEIGLGPYSLAVLFSLGIVLSTLVYAIFLLNLPLEGDPADLSEYVRMHPKRHRFGLLAGMVWCAGILANWVAGSVPPEIQVGKGAALVLSQGGMLLAALWGIGAWKDFREAGGAGKILPFIMLVLLGSGLAVLAMALGSGART